MTRRPSVSRTTGDGLEVTTRVVMTDVQINRERAMVVDEGSLQMQRKKQIGVLYQHVYFSNT